MLTTRDAARLLVAADQAALLRVLGFRPALPVPRATRRRLGLDDAAAKVRIAAGVGAVRALVVEWQGASALREQAATLCRTLARESPALLWLLVAHDGARHELVLAAPAPAGRAATAALRVDTDRVLESDAETLAALASQPRDSESLLHLRWREILGRDALTRRFYLDFERAVGTLAATAEGRAGPADRRTVAVLHASRLLFLAFLEAKGWLDRDRAFLRRAFEARCGGRGAHRRFLEPLFFGTLNTPLARRAPAARAFGQVPFLNGGLFTRTPVETRTRELRFTDGAIAALVGDLLGRYRLTARETSTEWTEAAVDPEMLGRAFESLMASGERRAAGVFYTPHPLIVRLTGQAIDTALAGMPASPEALRDLRVLDPACGSGAFLVFALETIAARHAAGGDARPIATIRRDVLTRSIFGVDRDPTAVWLCQLRLWLSVVVEDEPDVSARLTPLPNLDRNIREGDALAGDGFGESPFGGDRALEPLRLRYARASGVRKRSLGRVLDRQERGRAISAATDRTRRLRAQRGELLASLRSRDLFQERLPPGAAARRELEALRTSSRAAQRELQRIRDGGALPFDFATHFPELARNGGVGVVLGNPPWVRTHRIPAAERASLRLRFESFRGAAWQVGADAAGAGRGFASQADLAALFVEQAVRLTRPDGVLALLLPSKLWSALAGGGIRRVLEREAPPVAIEVWEEGDAGFDAVVYPSALLARRRAPCEERGRDPVTLTCHHGERSAQWTVARSALSLDGSPGAPWLFLPRAARGAFDRLAASGSPLADSPLGRPVLGVKTGCNSAFVVERRGDDGDTALVRVASAGDECLIESDQLRPVLRGEDLRPFLHDGVQSRMAIIWTHDASGAPLAQLPPATRRWLRRWRRTLEARADSRGERWWSLFRTDAARTDRPRVVWSDIGRRPRALVLPAGDPAVPLNSCYVVRTRCDDDAHAFAALMNSDIAAAWLGAIAEPARGGYRRFLGWTCARLPIPRVGSRAWATLARIGRNAAGGQAPTADALSAAVCEAFDLPRAALDPLLAWDQR